MDWEEQVSGVEVGQLWLLCDQCGLGLGLKKQNEPMGR